MQRLLIQINKKEIFRFCDLIIFICLYFYYQIIYRLLVFYYNDFVKAKAFSLNYSLLTMRSRINISSFIFYLLNSFFNYCSFSFTIKKNGLLYIKDFFHKCNNCIYYCYLQIKMRKHSIFWTNFYLPVFFNINSWIVLYPPN